MDSALGGRDMELGEDTENVLRTLSGPTKRPVSCRFRRCLIVVLVHVRLKESLADSLVMRPHSEYAHRLLLGKDLVDKAVVNVDAS